MMCDSSRRTGTRRIRVRFALLSATAILAGASSSVVSAANAFDTSDPEYVSDADEMVASGKITRECHSAEGKRVSSCAAYAATLAYPADGAKTFVPIENVSADDVTRIKMLLGL